MFNFLKRSIPNGQPLNGLNGHQPPTSASSLPEIEERVFIEPVDARQTPASSNFIEKDQIPVVDRDHNIGLLYVFMDRNHEAKGYDDALLNPDSSHLQQNLDALKNELIRTINKVKTFYEDFIRETDYHIASRSRSGMVDMVEELEMKKNIAAGHMEKVKLIEANTQRDEGDCKGIMISYTRGFKNGLAAISHHHILTRKF
jgi:hypothetical protein